MVLTMLQTINNMKIQRIVSFLSHVAPLSPGSCDPPDTDVNIVYTDILYIVSGHSITADFIFGIGTTSTNAYTYCKS